MVHQRLHPAVGRVRHKEAAVQDAELLQRLLSGEAGAFRAMVRNHHAAMKRFARAIVGEASAEEVVQDAWLKVVAGLRHFEGRASLRSWLLRIVRNEAISRLRKEAREPETESAEGFEERYGPDGGWISPPAIWSAETPEALLAAKDMRAIIAKTLEDIPMQQRAVVTLKDVEGLAFNEICNVLEISASNARVLLHRGRRRLWSTIDAYLKG
jgi:RNA polymerase sigma-70 factor, ECF subfamily